MKRPMVLRIAPPRIRSLIYHRFYRTQPDKWRQLYREAALAFASKVRMNLCAGDLAHGEIAFTGFYELELSKQILKHARHGGLMLDVGANYGYFSLLWAAASRRNRVIALEASPRNQPALLHNVALNEFGRQIKVVAMAAGREAGRLSFSLGPEFQTGWGGFSNASGQAAIPVAVTTLDDLLDPQQLVEVLKIDVEGADTWVLYGAQKLLEAKRVKHIYFEQNNSRMQRLGILPNEATDFLRKIGYRVVPLHQPDSNQLEFYASVGA